MLLLALALAQEPTFHQAAPCATCHEAIPEEPSEHVPDFPGCKSCHSATPHAGATAHLGPLPEPMRAQLEASGLRLTEEREVVCMTCHDPHSEAPRLMRLEPATGELCRACHSEADMDAEPASRSPKSQP